MNISGRHIAILVDDYFEQAEFEEPLSALKNAGGEVTVIATQQSKLHGMNHAEVGDSFQADLLLNQANSDDYDALVLPGGVINADKLRINATAQQWAVSFLESGRPLAAICHAPWLLVSADAVEGRRLTSYHTLKDDITNAGGEWVDLEVVVDDNLITSRKPDDLPKFNDALLTMLSTQAPGTLQTGADNMAGRDEQATEADNRLRSLGYDTQRDQLSSNDVKEILADDDMADPDALQPSDMEARERHDVAR
jgi:protease I